VILALCCGAGVAAAFFSSSVAVPAQALARPGPRSAAPGARSGPSSRPRSRQRFCRPARPARGPCSSSIRCRLADPQRVRRDLAVLDRSSERHLAEKLTPGSRRPPVRAGHHGSLLLGGAHLSLAVPLWASLVFMSAGSSYRLGIRAEAGRRRRDFRHALGSFLGPGRRRVGRRWRGRDRSRRRGEHRRQLGVLIPAPGHSTAPALPRDPVVSSREAGHRARDR